MTVRSADKKPENYVVPDGKTKTRMVPTNKEIVKKEDKKLDEISTNKAKKYFIKATDDMIQTDRKTNPKKHAKRMKGLQRAYKRLSAKEDTKLDEISQETKSSYKTKAIKNLRSLQKQRQQADRKHYIDNDADAAKRSAKLSKKIDNRYRGYSRASRSEDIDSTESESTYDPQNLEWGTDKSTAHAKDVTPGEKKKTDRFKTHSKNMDEAKKKKSGEDPCWDDHEMVGHKMKNGKKVPNCVPKESTTKEVKMKDFQEIRERRRTGPTAQRSGGIRSELVRRFRDEDTGMEQVLKISKQAITDLRNVLEPVADGSKSGKPIPEIYAKTALRVLDRFEKSLAKARRT